MEVFLAKTTVRGDDMKSKLLVFSLSAMLILSACGGKPGGTGTASGKGIPAMPEVKTAAAGNSATQAAYREAYAPVLDEFYKFAAGSSDGDKIAEGALGVEEAIGELRGDAALKMIGYTIQDISGDGIPELLIGRPETQEDASSGGNEIFAVYTCREGKPLGVFEGWRRNNFRYMGQGRFYNEGANGAMYGIFATYTIAQDGSSLLCNDYYFTHEKGQDMSEVAYFHNTSGQWDTKVSEELKTTGDQFWQMADNLVKQTKTVPLTPLTKYKSANTKAAGSASVMQPQVRAQWAKDALSGYASYDSFIADQGEYAVKVLFSVSRNVKDFKVLALTPQMQNDTLTYSVRELYTLKSLTPERPLVATMVFYGDTPNNGISYVDANGQVRRFALGQSGMDGSLYLNEF